MEIEWQTYTYAIISKGEMRKDAIRKSWEDTDIVFNSCWWFRGFHFVI